MKQRTIWKNILNFDRILEEILVIAKLFLFAILFEKIFVRQEQILAAALKINIFSKKNLFARKQEEIREFSRKKNPEGCREKEISFKFRKHGRTLCTLNIVFKVYNDMLCRDELS